MLQPVGPMNVHVFDEDRSKGVDITNEYLVVLKDSRREGAETVIDPV